jgi:hypothetical protein
MSRKRLILASLGGLVGLLALTAWILDKSGVFVRALRPQVVSALSQATGRQAKVASLEGGVFGSIVLNDLSLGYRDKPSAFDASVTVRKAVVRFSLWDFFVLKKDAFQSLRSLKLDSPQIDLRILPLAAGDRPLPKLSLATLLSNLPLPPIATSIEGGRVSLSLSTQGQGKVVFEALNAEVSADAAKGFATLVLGGRAYGGRLGIKGQFRPASATASLSLDLLGLDLAQWSHADWLPEGVPPLLAGKADGRFKLELGTSFSAKGTLNIGNVALTIPKAGDLTDLQAELRLDGRKLSLDSLRFSSQGATWQGRGEVEDLAAPDLFLHVGSVEGRPSWHGFSADRALLALRASGGRVAL